MGRRKDRRLAALSGAGRRVKLDLFAEPSGDFGGSFAQDEVGGDDDIKNRSGLPNPPFSSGKQAENPLALLGQYSDDELDNGSSGEKNKDVSDDSLVMLDDDQEKSAAGRGSEDFEIKEGNGPSADKVEQLAVENGSALMESLEKLQEDAGAGIHATDTGVLHDVNGLAEQATDASNYDTEVVGDVSSGWKIVLHEESNQYYYWNITTGETSWEVPGVIAPATELKNNAVDNEQKDKGVSDAADQNSKTTEGIVHAFITEILNEGFGGDASEDKKWDRGHDALGDLGTSPGTNVSPWKSDDVLPHDGNTSNINLLKPGHKGCYDTGTDLSSRLLKQGENLLEQLNIVTTSKSSFQGHERIHKCILEIEVRLADMKSLACHGSSLLPFWELSGRRLEQLEAVINDVLQESQSELVNGLDKTSIFPETICEDIKANFIEEKASDDFGVSESAGVREFRKTNLEMDDSGATTAENVPSDRNPVAYPGNSAGGKVEVGLAMHQDSTPKTVLHTGEEVDMDVDMEVEDADPPSNLTVSVPSEPLNLPTLTPGQDSSAPLESCNIPPPPDEDWIPPPPPDNEPFPPPPPDEPPEISYPQPSDLVSIQSLPHAEPYNLYPSSHFQYYAQGNTDIAASNLYAQTDGCQPTVSQPPLYFGALSETYGPATLAVNPIDPGLYYGLQDGISQPFSEFSGFDGGSVQNPISDSTGSTEAQAVLGSVSVPKVEGDIPAISEEAKKPSLEPSSSQATFQTSATVSADNVSDSLVPATTASDTATTTAPRAQSKVQRNKKRTVAVVSTLKSNKKVSSLVDKWKAAKEELQEEEKEPESAYEILEKKRQREIEEWHAQQIASREANNNANFQPLGGDWRERVKRKRAKLAKDSVQIPSDGVSEPNLDELSRGLPHGWQVYWDDSSKQVYYGNSLTSETTWIRPTN
ncbi:hypothetical protein ACH5RR_027736 [Cinchona calisaya]|uniref:WW domain-containing protein n=1 Tax=Cinchona calisaya TaxID=153742 RepID=A0ABD2YQC0_9GENT